MNEIKKIRKEHPYWFWLIAIATSYKGIGIVLILLSGVLWRD